MKLPGKDDPFGDKEGSLPRQLVLEALFKGHVNVSHLPEGYVQLVKNDVGIVVRLDDPIGGLMVKNLMRQFDLSLADLYGTSKYH